MVVVIATLIYLNSRRPWPLAELYEKLKNEVKILDSVPDLIKENNIVNFKDNIYTLILVRYVSI
jgi:hypothetical protein